jgi:hypothetical protein
MSGKQANNHPGLHRIKGQQSDPNGNTRVRDQLSSLSLSASKSLPQYQMLFMQPALNFLLYTLPRDSQGQLRSYKMVTGTPLASSSAISFPRILECPGTQKSPTK